MKELSRTYEPAAVESRHYQNWLDKGYFHSEPKPGKTPFTVMIPPPNVTGMLTMGHVLNNTLQDVLVRKARMEGHETLWLPGTDHAGIATQTAVEKNLRKDNITRHDLGRETFIGKVWEWKHKYGGIIIEQLKRLGVSCDWERERFTMDEGLSQAVREVFVRLYDKKLIYRGLRIINWCPVSLTALSDEEVIYRESQGHLWYLRYPLADGSGNYLVVATTRPETMLGDTGIAVNPDDERYRDLIGKTVKLPLTDREIPIFADEYVDKEFGTGAVKVTPAHDPNDYEMGLRHKLEIIDIMNPDATLNDRAGAEYSGLDRYEARKKVVAEFEKLGLLEKIENYTHSVGYSERAGVVIEPRLSEQWFVKMKELAEPALKVVNEGRISFTPDRWLKTYNHWLENVRDWCISRQLWWGHRIPVFHCDACGWEAALTEDPTSCPKCSGDKVRQEEDVLDTWFSSWLWPFSTLDWPNAGKDLEYYYPTNDLVTAPDIIFFWVARMIMAGLEFMGDIPFRNVYFTGLIRDAQGRKMSKSLGNSPDPLHIIDKFGADALRFGILLIAPQGQDILFDENRIETGRNFMNKLWNAARFILMNNDKGITGEDLPVEKDMETADLWILDSLQDTINRFHSDMEKYRFNDAARTIYEFTWNYFCDWYIELAKIRFYGDDSQAKDTSLKVAVYVLRTILKLLHPFAPFITEDIWQSLKADEEPDLIVASFPGKREFEPHREAVGAMDLLMQIITAARTIRSEMTVPPAKKATLLISGPDDAQTAILESGHGYIENLVRCEKLSWGPNLEKPALSASAVVGGLQLYMPLVGLIDLEKERQRLLKEIDAFESRLKGVRAKLGNHNFTLNAPKDVVEKERDKEKSYTESLALLKENLSQLTE